MRTIEKVAIGMGIANAVIGALSMFSPFVKPAKKRGLAKLIPSTRKRGIVNNRPGMLLGQVGAVNPPHAVMHSALGAAGLGTRALKNSSRGYILLNGLLYSALAALGWSKVGFRPGIHKAMGMAVDRRGNIIHTLWGLGALAMALKPDLFRRSSSRNMDFGAQQHVSMTQVGME